MLESIIVAIQQPPRWILKVVRGPSKFEWREAKIGISADPRGLSVTETRYQHGFASPSPWCKPTAATRRRWSAACRGHLPAAGAAGRSRGGKAGERALRHARWRGRSGEATRCSTPRNDRAAPRPRRSAVSLPCPARRVDGWHAGGRAGGSVEGRRRCNLVAKTPLPLLKKVNSEL